MNCQPALQNTRQETKLCGNSSAAASLRHSEIENTPQDSAWVGGTGPLKC